MPACEGQISHYSLLFKLEWRLTRQENAEHAEHGATDGRLGDDEYSKTGTKVEDWSWQRLDQTDAGTRSLARMTSQNHYRPDTHPNKSKKSRGDTL